MAPYGGFLVFTDFGGTLMDRESGQWMKASEAIKTLKERNIPMIPCPSETRAEIEFYMGEMEMSGPFISEDGSAVFVPSGYFGFDFEHSKMADGYKVIEFGEPYARIRELLSLLKPLGGIVGIGDMTVEEVAEEMGLTIEEAELAKRREYSEMFRFDGDEGRMKKVLEHAGVSWTARGRYWRAMKGGNKGKAVKALTSLYRSVDPGLKTVGVGDSFRDISMLKAVDIPILIRKNDGSFDAEAAASVENLRRSDDPGPEGWNEQIMLLLGSAKA